MTDAHLGDRGACRRRSYSATAAPREGSRRRGQEFSFLVLVWYITSLSVLISSSSLTETSRSPLDTF